MLSIGSVAAEPSKWLSQDQYWFVEKGKDASTSTTGDGEQIVRTLTAGDTIAYCTRSTAQTQTSDDVDKDGNPIEVEVLNFNSEKNNEDADIPDGSGYFVRMSAKFTPRGTPQVVAPNGIGDFPYRTLIYVKEENNHLAFLERKEGECAAEEVVTDLEVAADKLLDITVQILKNNLTNPTFRVYVDESEVTVGGAKRPYRSLQTGEGNHYAAQKMHSFAFTGKVAFNSIEFTTEKPSWFPESVDSVPFTFVYDTAAVTIEDSSQLPVTVEHGQTYTISITRNTDKYTFESPPLFSGNSATLTEDSTLDIIKFKVPDTLTDDNPLVLTLPSKAYFFTLNGKEYGTFDEIIAAASESENKTITITRDIYLDASVSPGAQAYIKDSQTVVIDLMGKKITGGVYRPDADDAAILNRGRLKIIDTSAEKTGTIEAYGFAISTGDKLALENDANETIIKAGIFNGIVTNVAGRIQIDGGKFYNAFNQTNEERFYLRNQSGISISAKFKAAVIEDNYWQAPSVVEEGCVMVEYRPNHGSAEPSLEELSEEEAAQLDAASVKDKVKVTAPGYDTETIEWTKEGDDTIWHGAMTALVFKVTYELGGKGAFESEPKSEFSIEDPIRSLPVPVDYRELWELDYWYREGDEKTPVTELGDAESPFADVKLVAKWKPKTITWTNAKTGSRYMAMTEANGYFTTDTKWQLTIPASNGFEYGDSVALKSITLSTVNASPNNLARMAPILRLTVGGKTYDATAALDKTKSTEFGYFDSNYGFRPKIVYSFDASVVISVGSSYTFTLVSKAEGGAYHYHPSLLRLVKKTGYTEFQLVTTVGTDLPSADYQSYVPMYEIVGVATDVNEGAE